MTQSLSIQKLLDEFERLPGIGPKSAQRIVYWLLNAAPNDAQRLAQAIVEVKETVHFCTQCFNYAEADTCAICSDDKRNNSVICVVSEPRDVSAIERTRQFDGVYHVLGGAISPIDGVGPDNLTIKELLQRLAGDEVKEVLLATNSNVEGETTAVYLSKLIKAVGVRTTRLASGLPVGGDIEFADELTLGRAIESRREF